MWPLGKEDRFHFSQGLRKLQADQPFEALVRYILGSVIYVAAATEGHLKVNIQVYTARTQSCPSREQSAAAAGLS